MIQEMIVRDYGVIEQLIELNQKELDEIGQGGQAMRWVGGSLSEELFTTISTFIYTSITITNTIISVTHRNYTAS